MSRRYFLVDFYLLRIQSLAILHRRLFIAISVPPQTILNSTVQYKEICGPFRSLGKLDYLSCRGAESQFKGSLESTSMLSEEDNVAPICRLLFEATFVVLLQRYG